MLSESRLSLQCKIQTSCGFFPESHFPQITGVFVGLSLYFVERDRRRFPRSSRHILRGQRENERSGIGRPGSVDQAELAADVALYVEQFKPLRHLALCHSIALATHSASARLLPKVQASIAP
jgi:hypothetical protein